MQQHIDWYFNILYLYLCNFVLFYIYLNILPDSVFSILCGFHIVKLYVLEDAFTCI